MTAIEQQITELGNWAASLELSAYDPTSPYWMRQKDAERATRIRAEQENLLRLAQLNQSPLTRCASPGCTNLVAGTTICARCEDVTTAVPYPHANVLSEPPKWSRIAGIFFGALAIMAGAYVLGYLVAVIEASSR